MRIAYESLGHHGEKATWENLRTRFYWLQMYQDVHHHVKPCHECQIQSTIKMHLPITTLPPSTIFTKVHMDIMLMPPAKGFRYLVLVTIFLLSYNLLLLVCSLRVHILFGMCRNDYVSLLLVVHPFHSRMFVLWHPHTVPLYHRKGISLIFFLLLPRTLSPPLGSHVPST